MTLSSIKFLLLYSHVLALYLCFHVTRAQIHCNLDEWTEWTPCSSSCGDGEHYRLRGVDNMHFISTGVAFCDKMMEVEPCTGSCPTDPCVLGEWTPWSVCTPECGPGKRMRVRGVEVPSVVGGNCEPTTEVEDCQIRPCNDCSVTEWTEWGDCSKTCGTGKQFRFRMVISPPDELFSCDVEFTDAQDCNTDMCECKLSEWSEPTQCSRTCGGGESLRFRSVITLSEEPYEKTCPELISPGLIETTHCSVSSCSSDIVSNDTLFFMLIGFTVASAIISVCISRRMIRSSAANAGADSDSETDDQHPPHPPPPTQAAPKQGHGEPPPPPRYSGAPPPHGGAPPPQSRPPPR